jgi:hypothetical protein
MKDYDFKGILAALSEASPSHLALASFVVFPIVLNYWLEAILKLFPEMSTGCRLLALVVLVGIYIACLIWLAKESSRRKGLEVKRDLVLGRLSSNDWTEMGFDSAKKVLGEDTPDEKIHELIQAFPKTLRYVRMRIRDKDGNIQKDEKGNIQYKSGVGRVKAEIA